MCAVVRYNPSKIVRLESVLKYAWLFFFYFGGKMLALKPTKMDSHRINRRKSQAVDDILSPFSRIVDAAHKNQ